MQSLVSSTKTEQIPSELVSVLCSSDSNCRKSFSVKFTRRSDKCPPQPREVKYHPSSVDNMIVESLLNWSSHKTLKEFLIKEFSCMSSTKAEQVLGKRFFFGLD